MVVAAVSFLPQSRGADPSLLTADDESSYLNPGPKTVIDVAVEDEAVRGRLRALNDKYSSEFVADGNLCGWAERKLATFFSMSCLSASSQFADSACLTCL